jgi:hypothetical protein
MVELMSKVPCGRLATIVEVTPDDIAEHPQTICFINPKHELYHKKVDWLKERFRKELKIKPVPSSPQGIPKISRTPAWC